MNREFKTTDIIVWGGVITTFGVAQYLIRDMDNVRLATKKEIKRYHNRPEK